MWNLLKSTVVGVGLLAGVAATAQAQSVSGLPPTDAATPYSSTKIVPNPGGSALWRQEPYQPTASDKIYPNPGGSSSWRGEHYQPTAGYDADKSQHPYSSMGPKPN